jgi:hypothetical protein
LAPELHVDEDTFDEVVRHLSLADLVKQKRKKGKVNLSELAYCLAAVKVSQSKGPHLLVPYELVELIGETLISQHKWAAAQKVARDERLDKERQYWQAFADPVWEPKEGKHPDWKRARMAEHIVPKAKKELAALKRRLGWRRSKKRTTVVNRVRRMIRPPPK